MARPNKQGAEYFPLDVHLDDKFKFIEIKYKLEGFAIIIKLIQKVYSYGYWYRWTEDEALLFSDEIRADYDLVNNVVNEAIERGIFNKDLHTKYNILTSTGIQKRYKEIVRRRKDVEVTEEYLLIDNNFGVNDDINPSSSKRDDGKSTQSKVKESKEKVKGTKVKETKTKYAEFVSMLETEYKKLLEQFGEIGTKERIENLNLYKGSTGKKYKDDYLTILSWERKNGKTTTFRGQANKKPTWDEMTRKTAADEEIFGNPIDYEYDENDLEF